jgi:hypothetical protein
MNVIARYRQQNDVDKCTIQPIRKSLRIRGDRFPPSNLHSHLGLTSGLPKILPRHRLDCFSTPGVVLNDQDTEDAGGRRITIADRARHIRYWTLRSQNRTSHILILEKPRKTLRIDSVFPYLSSGQENALTQNVPCSPPRSSIDGCRTFSVLFLLSCFGFVNGQTVAPNEDATIRQQLAGYAEARTQGSGKEQASFYVEDGDERELFASGKTYGRIAIAKLLDLPREPNRRFRLEILDALVDAHWYRETYAKPKGRV